jgi:hypothetical protein
LKQAPKFLFYNYHTLAPLPTRSRHKDEIVLCDFAVKSQHTIIPIVAVDFSAVLDYYRSSCSFTTWGRNGFDGDKEAQVAYQAPVGL